MIKEKKVPFVLKLELVFCLFILKWDSLLWKKNVKFVQYVILGEVENDLVFYCLLYCRFPDLLFNDIKDISELLDMNDSHFTTEMVVQIRDL